MTGAVELAAHPMAITGEAPLWDAARNCLWWIDIQAQRLLRTSTSGDTTVTATPGQPGLVAHAESGGLVVGLETGLFVFDPDAGTWTQVDETEADRPTVRLNDGKPDARGRLWFGSMDMTGTGARIGRLYRRDPDGRVGIVREGVGVPNAIVPDPARGGLWFADTPTSVVEFLATDPGTGAVTETRKVHDFGAGAHPDGATLDGDGMLWIAVVGAGELVRMDGGGQVVARVPLPVSRPTMPAFGGAGMRTLYVTCQRRFLTAGTLAGEPFAGGLLAVDPGVAGAPQHRVAGL